MRLEGKIAIVSGAGSTAIGDVVGIGRAIATLFAREGCSVAVIDANLERATETRDAIGAEGGKAVAIQCDITDNRQVEVMIVEVLRSLGKPQILVNNAGISAGRAPLEDLDEALYRQVHEVNLLGAVRLSKSVSRLFVSARQGVFVNIASIGGMRSGAGVPYATSKAGLIALSRELALMYGRNGVRSNAIAPGPLYTPMVAGSMSQDVRERRRKISPLGIEGTAWDVAQAAVFLASDESRYITGTCLPVDGGVTSIGPLAALDLISSP